MVSKVGVALISKGDLMNFRDTADSMPASAVTHRAAQPAAGVSHRRRSTVYQAVSSGWCGRTCDTVGPATQTRRPSDQQL